MSESFAHVGKPKAVALYRAAAPLPPIQVVPGGREIPVRALDGIAYDMLRALEANEAEPDLIWALAQRILPTATPEEVRSCTPEMVTVLVGIASGKLAELEALLGSPATEATGPAEGNAPPPGTADRPRPRRPSRRAGRSGTSSDG